MLRYNSIVFLLLLSFLTLHAQNCNLTIRGQVIDHETEEGLAYVNILVLESNEGATSDEQGYYQLNGLCEGDIHLIFSHIGCEPEQRFLSLTVDTTVTVTLEHSSMLLEGVIVTGHHVPSSTQSTQVINSQSIADGLDQNLSNLLDNISGVYTLQNGATIGKPVIHGLFGNRITILNNGIAQAGQQWGNDHSPEIDPLIANRISVVKGVSALEYPGSNLGSIVIVEPGALKSEPHLHGSASYAYSSNGRVSATNLQLNRSSFGLDWKINATAKKGGDRQTSNYYLNNTGNEELNLALQLEKQFSTSFNSSLYFSTFNSELGILRGGHVGNTTDLENAFNRDEPFFTEDKFSYDIEAPRQLVNHHLLKSENQWFRTKDQWIEVNFAGQFNARKEFDVRRSGRSETPALSLRQWTLFGEGKYTYDVQDLFTFKTGVQVNTIDNTNDPETGILPLIPDYLAYETGLYTTFLRYFGPSSISLGGRYDRIFQDVPAISSLPPYQIVRYRNNYDNVAVSIGWRYEMNSFFQSALNVGYATRNPAINELYSNGLHQGVSGIEEGSIDLNSEKSTKFTWALQGKDDRRFGFEVLFYYQHINDYIYLQPSGENRLTIRGAFPVFVYEQTDALISGLDFSGQFQLAEHWKVASNFSYLRGQDLEKKVPLIFIPPNQGRLSLKYFFDQFDIFGREIENFEIEVNDRYVFRQSRFVEGQDFIDPPEAYNLLGASVSGEVQWLKLRTRLYLRGDNLLNVSYRDYLNRQRYFADDLGINITLGIKIKF